uniref:protein-glutamine gamma-glutamyltransferase n=1 Tax=Arion vulgaris TaxID=1028688 RepID=A0A0B7A7F1_9EUPU
MPGRSHAGRPGGRGRRAVTNTTRVNTFVSQPTFVNPPAFGSQPAIWSGNFGGGWEIASGDILDTLRGRGTLLDNFGRGDVYVYTYGSWDNNTGPHGGTHVVPSVPKPKPKPEPKPEVKPEVKPEAKPELKPLTVRVVNLKVSANGAAHRTNKYAISAPLNPSPILVVRRGQPFSVQIEFSRPYDQKIDDLKLVFEAGDKPLTSKQTHVEFILSDDDKPKEWGAKIVSTENATITIDVYTPPTCFVGKWAFSIDVVKKEGSDVNVFRYLHRDPIYIIFNPWCKDDTVYMPDEALLNEYILNEVGRIFIGSKTSISSKPWNFAQFESHILDVAFHLLDISEMNWAIRGSAIPIIRKLSAMVNGNDDGGILTGNWSGDYSGGSSPLSWTGSAAILDEFWRNRSPVRFGQCWVFSGVATTICRALGIPARSVTNFGSAHDTDGSITIDVHFKPNGELDDSNNYDSVWNFHVWNEAWMARPDLPVGYGGWQAFDATPQETSDGVYCGGPTSVIAIQQGEVNLPYDGPFVFAEVNADRLYWTPNKLGVMECTYFDTKAIGKFISTKAANSSEREDLTESYKYAEGSPEERAAVLKANQVGSRRQDIYKRSTNDVKFKVVQVAESSWVGASFEVGLSMKNNSEEKRSVSGRIVVRSMFYTGVSADKLKSEPFTNIVLKPGEEKVQNVVVTQDEYDGKLKDCCMMDVSILAHVDETDQNFTILENYTLQKPHLSVKAPSEVTVNKEFKVDVSFANPLSSSLTGCVVTIDGLSQALKFPQGNVSPSGTFTATLPVNPTKLGNLELIVIFNSVQLEDINASCPILVRP